MAAALTKTDVPSTLRKVVIKCRAVCCDAFTYHKYVRDSVLGDVRHLVFECCECATERQYGCEGR